MQLRPLLAILAVIALVLVVGCVAVPSGVGGGPDANGPAGDLSEDVTTVGHSEQVTVNGSLPVDATQTYRRVERLMNASAPAPTVEVETSERSPRIDRRPSPTYRALGFTNETGEIEPCGRIGSASAGYDGEVTISPVDPISGDDLTASQIELILAHEYAHVVQRRVGGFENASDSGDFRLSAAMSEGSAVYVAEAYAHEYDLQWEGGTPFSVRECLYDRTRNRLQQLSGIYYFGGLHFDHRLDDPAELPAAFETPPNTTEQLVRGETPASEPVAPLSVDAAGGRLERVEPHEFGGGELAVRRWLRTGLSERFVAVAASGWGNGELLAPSDDESLSRGDARELRNVAWVLRWDTAADAEEFDAALDDLEPTLEDRSETDLRHVRVAPETVVVFGGETSFVEDASANGTNGSVTVSAS